MAVTIRCPYDLKSSPLKSRTTIIVKVSIVKMAQYLMFNCPVAFLSDGSLNNAKAMISPPSKVLEYLMTESTIYLHGNIKGLVTETDV